MLEIIDPEVALHSFQKLVRRGALSLARGVADTSVRIYRDHVEGSERLTCARLQSGTVTAYAAFIETQPYEGQRCFSVEACVPEAFRNQGRAKDIIRAGIAELRQSLSLSSSGSFFVEAIVADDNAAFMNVATSVLSPRGTALIDPRTGLTSTQFFLRVQVQTLLATLWGQPLAEAATTRHQIGR